MSPATTRAAVEVKRWADSDAARVLSTVASKVRDARDVLGSGDPLGAASHASALLHHVEDLLDHLSASHREDTSTWVLAVTLRDELSGYLLAASTLEETGVAPGVIVHVLQRGAGQAEELLGRLTTANESR
jgi:hypothetical protein